ncbi:MAG: division plane positioning ATPase MipZ [Xanthobacteraceae bacterium]|nr:division plane positioning ATPase MipZ [Xanthobacteraceae bacterium]
MSFDKAFVSKARVIVVGNEKGGSGKSTVAMHISVALLKLGHRVATLDLDTRQKSFTAYLENRRTWAGRVNRALQMPEHFTIEHGSEADEAAGCTALADKIDALAETYDAIVIDTPGRDGSLARLAHSMADTLVTPLNDSFVDFDLLGTVDPETFAVSGINHYAQMVDDVRTQRRMIDSNTIDWIVLRNRLSMTSTRNKRLVGQALTQLSQMLDFRCVDGFAERMIFREFFPRGLTALDDLNEATLGTRPTMSHVTARQEVATLINAMALTAAKSAAAVTEAPDQARDAA